MNGLDIALLVVLLFFLIRGIFRGFIKEITSVAGVIVGFILANRYYPVAADAIKPFLQNPAYRQTIGFLIVFLLVFIVVSLLGLLLGLIFKLALSKTTDGLLGAFIAVTKGLLLASVVLMGTTAFIRPESPFYAQSVTWPYMSHLTNSLKRMVPEDLRNALESKVEMLKPMADQLSGSGLGAETGEQLDQPLTSPPPWQPVAPPDQDQPPPPTWPGSGDNN